MDKTDAATETGCEFMTAGELAEMLRCSMRTLESWRWRGGGFGPKYVKVGGRIMYQKSDVKQWLDANSGQ